VLTFVVYIAMDIAASLAYDGYSYRDQTISELSAIGAPTRTFWVIAAAGWHALLFAFAFGVLAVAGQRRSVRAVGWFILAGAIVGFLWWIAPMHRREVLAADGGDWRDTMHLVVGGMNSLLFFAMIGAGAFAFGRGFRWYSFATIAAMLIFGTLMGIESPDVNKDGSTPWLGIYERIAIEGAFLWQGVFAGMLLWLTPARDAGDAPGPTGLRHTPG
jgi:hypothetical protein